MANLSASSHPENNHTFTTTEQSVDDQGRKVEITKTIGMPKIITKLPRSAAGRSSAKWTKFGCVAGLPMGPDSAHTRIADEVSLLLSRPALAALMQAGASGSSSDASAGGASGSSGGAAASGGKRLTCRHCGGEHWTTKCPYKDTLAELDAASGGSSAGFMDGTDGGAAFGGASGPGKYIPPSMRARMEAAGGNASMMGMSADEGFTLKVNNLSVIATEESIGNLFMRVAGGSIRRVFLPRDRETGDCRGFGFITYDTKEDAQHAIDKLDRYGFDHLILRVEWAANRKPMGSL